MVLNLLLLIACQFDNDAYLWQYRYIFDNNIGMHSHIYCVRYTLIVYYKSASSISNGNGV